jgi:hypothetical protein
MAALLKKAIDSLEIRTVVIGQREVTVDAVPDFFL